MKFQEESSSIGSEHFLKMKDGESVKGIFRGDPYEFKQHWIKDETGERSFACTGNGCEECKKGGEKARFRFHINFITRDKDAQKYVAKIFDQSWTTYCALRDLQKTGYELEKTIVLITRTGSKLQTKWKIIPVPNTPLTPTMEQEINAIVLHDLANPQKSEDKSKAANYTEDDIPF